MTPRLAALGRRALLLGALGIGGLGVGALSLSPKAALAGQAVKQPAASFTLPELAGGQLKLEDLRGKVVVIDFFASWCEPCLKELPALELLNKKLAPAGVVFVAINIDRERKNAVELADRFKLTMKVLLDPNGQVAERYDPPKMPSSYVVDQAGVVQYLNEGFSGAADIAKLEKQIGALLKAEPAKAPTPPPPSLPPAT